MESKYKVGDKVLIKDELSYGHDGVVKSMLKYAGAVVTITAVTRVIGVDEHAYCAEGNGEQWWWRENSIQCRVEDVEVTEEKPALDTWRDLFGFEEV